MKKHIGTTLDSLFEELGEKEEVGLLTQKKLRGADPGSDGMPERERGPAAINHRGVWGGCRAL
jgi:hypothetical protein